MRLAWAEFIQLVDTKHPERNVDIKSLLEQVNDMVDDMDQPNADMFYIDIVEDVCLLRASREGNWDLHPPSCNKGHDRVVLCL